MNNQKLKKCYHCWAELEDGGGKENIFGQLLCWSCWMEILGEDDVDKHLKGNPEVQ